MESAFFVFNREKGTRARLKIRGVNWNMGGMTERRTTRRYDLSLPIIVRMAAEKISAQQTYKTRDISTRGLYFVMDQDLEAGSVLELTLTLPPEVTRGAEVFVHASGRVVRVEPRIEDGNARKGIAAVIERYDIIRGEAARA
ncbi:MAG TPA: PilZ domain-containing protein [Terriglobales bacterium]|nr:PilZ domain-containing protein [Terriglobales bacterium]